MPALAASRNTNKMGIYSVPDVMDLGVKAATICYQGGIAVNDAGVAAPGRVATGLVALGVFLQTYNNSAGAANGIRAEIETGVFKLANSASADLIIAADVGKTCFIVDDQQVAKTDGTGTRSLAGRVIRVDADGVFVGIGPQFA